MNVMEAVCAKDGDWIGSEINHIFFVPDRMIVDGWAIHANMHTQIDNTLWHIKMNGRGAKNQYRNYAITNLYALKVLEGLYT